MMNSTKNSWLPQEDEVLLQLHVTKGIQSWADICKILIQKFGSNGKTPKTCRERFNNHLNPHINRGQWTQQQETLLIALQKEMGNRWAEISRQLPGRTDNSVKNKFYSKYRRAIKNINSLLTRYRISKVKQLKISFVYKVMNFLDKNDQSCLSRNIQYTKTAKFIKNQIIKFQIISSSNEETQTIQKCRLQELVAAIQKFSSNGKKKLTKIKIKKCSKLEQQFSTFQMTPLQNSQQKSEKTNDIGDDLEELPPLREEELFYPCLFEEEFFVPLEQKKTDYHDYSLLFDEIYQEESEKFWRIDNGEDSFQF